MLNAAITHLKEGNGSNDIGDAITMYDRYWTELKTIQQRNRLPPFGDSLFF